MPEICGYFELFFVNILGMPYNSGVFIYLIVLAAVLVWAIYETMRETPRMGLMKLAFILSVVLIGIPFIGNGYIIAVLFVAALSYFLFRAKKVNMRTLNTILISLMVLVIGYSSIS